MPTRSQGPTRSQAPKIAKGRIHVFDLAKNTQQAIVFQYNPAAMSRTLEPPLREPSGAEGQRVIALRYKSAPVETFNLDVEINAADQLEAGDPETGQYGVLPQLAALEILLYPRSDDVKRADDLLDNGQIEVASGYDAPFTLLEWGQNRTIPVIVTSFSVTEEIFDPQLNPIVASVKLGLRALSYSDVIRGHKGYDYFMTYQQNKERMAGRS